MPGAESEKTALEHAWRYFDLHAKQRISVFNFYVATSSLLAGGLAYSLVNHVPWPLGLIAGFLVAVFSFVFWKLDQRVTDMIKVAERVIIEIEARTISDPCLRTMTQEESTRLAMKSGYCFGRWTYGRSFRCIFSLMAFMGLCGAAITAYRAVHP